MRKKADDKITCRVCSKQFQLITPQHLYKHGLTLDEYRAKFPDATLKAESSIVKTLRTQNDLFKKEELKKIGVSEGINEIEKTPSIKKLKGETSILQQIEKAPKKENSKVKKFTPRIEELNNLKINTDEILEPKFPNVENIPKGKLAILNYLVTKFPDIKNNFFIEKQLINNRIEFRFVTDIVIFDRRIDIEFPNAFWHNYDIPKVTRDEKIIKEGWEIINVNSRMPTVDDVKKELEKNNLI